MTDRLGPLAGRFRDELAQLRKQNTGSIPDDDDARSQVAYLAGIDALQESSQKIFDEEVDREAMSPTAATVCSIIGTCIFWVLMAGPVIALYAAYLKATSNTFTNPV